MYAYRPRFEKKKEKLLVLFLAVLGIVLYVTAQFPQVPFRTLMQMVALGCLVSMILLISMCILRRYEYVLEETEEGKTDFVITEYYSRRKTVVCRVGLDDVGWVAPYASELKKTISKEKHKIYSYTGVLFDEKRFIVEVNAHGEYFFVIICADETLLNLLLKR